MNLERPKSNLSSLSRLRPSFDVLGSSGIVVQALAALVFTVGGAERSLVVI